MALLVQNPEQFERFVDPFFFHTSFIISFLPGSENHIETFFRYILSDAILLQ
jgi:hypothetical protein